MNYCRPDPLLESKTLLACSMPLPLAILAAREEGERPRGAKSVVENRPKGAGMWLCTVHIIS